MGLSREVLKWIQSLDLSNQIRHPKRDIANGLIIAEIFSRYYPGELQISCFYTGNSSVQKSKNWSQLEKFFKRNQIQIPKGAISAVMNCYADSAVLFIENIFTMLTGKEVAKAPHNEEELIPNYCLPTTISMIKFNSNASPEKAQNILISHQEYIKEVREKMISRGNKAKKELVKLPVKEHVRPDDSFSNVEVKRIFVRQSH